MKQKLILDFAGQVLFYFFILFLISFSLDLSQYNRHQPISELFFTSLNKPNTEIIASLIISSASVFFKYNGEIGTS